MGHSTSILALRSGLTFKWNVFFVSSHYINYFYEYNYFFNLVRNYLYYLIKYKYRKFFRIFGIYFAFFRLNVTKLNTLNIKIYLFDQFFSKSFHVLLKQFAAPKMIYIYGRKKKKKNKRRFFFFRSNKRRKFFRFLTDDFKKQLKRFNCNSDKDRNNLFNFYGLNKLFINLKFPFLQSRLYRAQYGYKFFLKNGFFYESRLFFKRKQLLRFFNLNTFLLKSYFFFKARRFNGLNKLKLAIKKRMDLKPYRNQKLYYNFHIRQGFVNYKKYVYNFRMNNKFYVRAKTSQSFFKTLFSWHFSTFFFKKFIKFSLRKKQFGFNGKYFFLIAYLIYQMRYRKIRFMKKIKDKKKNKNRKSYKRHFTRSYIKFTRMVPAMMLNIIKIAGVNTFENKKNFKFMLRYFYYLLKRWFWLLIISSVLKQLYIYLYKTLKIIIFNKLVTFFEKESLYTKKSLNLQNINIYPIADRTLSVDLILRFIVWKMKRRFTINQTVWPFLKNLRKKSRFIRGFFLKGSGRFTKKQRAGLKKYKYGKVNFSTYYSRLNYGFSTIITRYGTCGLKFWMNVSRRYTKHKYNKIHKIDLY